MNKNKLFKLVLISVSISISPFSFGEVFVPKVVCLDEQGGFIGWLTKRDCENQAGVSPSELKNSNRKTNK